MRTLVRDVDSASVLDKWQGAEAQIWIFDLSFRRLALLLTKAHADEILYVVGVGCEHISGPFRWYDARLSITTSDTKRSKATGNSLTRLFDQSVGFELLCASGVWMVRGLKTDIVKSFGDEFLKQLS